MTSEDRPPDRPAWAVHPWGEAEIGTSAPGEVDTVRPPPPVLTPPAATPPVSTPLETADIAHTAPTAEPERHPDPGESDQLTADDDSPPSASGLSGERSPPTPSQSEPSAGDANLAAVEEYPAPRAATHESLANQLMADQGIPASSGSIEPPGPSSGPELTSVAPPPEPAVSSAARALDDLPAFDDLTAHPEPSATDMVEEDQPTLTRRHPASQRALPRTLAIANQKGGVGKTTTAVNLGASLAELDYRVLVVDLDPQGNATTGLGINARSLDTSIYDVLLHDVPLVDVIEPTSLRNLFVVPATIDLAGAEIELVPVFSRELRLKRAIETVSADFDFVLIDCPPSLGLLTVNGLAAATEVAVPIQCEYYALEGLGQLLRNVNLVKANLNPTLEMSTIILTMFDGRTRLAEQVVDEVRNHFGNRVCRNVVPRTVRLSEAPSFGQPIIVFDSSSRGAIAYRELAKEVSGGASKRLG